MRKFISYTIFILVSSLNAQIGGLDWTNIELAKVETVFQGYSNFRMNSAYMASGMKQINEDLSTVEMISFIGSTPIHKRTILLFNNGQQDYKPVYDLFVKYQSQFNEVKTIYSFSKMSLAAGQDNIIKGFQYEKQGHIIETVLIYDRGSGAYRIHEVIYNNGRKYFVFDELDSSDIPQWKDYRLSGRAMTYWETIGIQNLNPFRLSEYSELFGKDLTLFHNSATPIKVFGFLGGGYLSFGDLPSNILGLANGMNENCIENITISSQEWNKANDWKRLWVIYHEIAHDLYGVQHGEGGELMNAVIPENINFLDFYLAKLQLLEYVKNLDLQSVRCQ